MKLNLLPVTFLSSKLVEFTIPLTDTDKKIFENTKIFNSFDEKCLCIMSIQKKTKDECSYCICYLNQWSSNNQEHVSIFPVDQTK